MTGRQLGHKASRSLTQADLVALIKYVIDFGENLHNRDDIDHLENKRVRSVGELLQNQMRLGFLRMEKVARERMTAADAENVVPQVVLSVKPISASHQELLRLLASSRSSWTRRTRWRS